MRKRRYATSRSAFTLISLVVTLGIIAACAAIAGHYYEGVLQGRRVAEARVRMRQVRDAFLLYQVRHKGADPADLAALKKFIAAPDGAVDPWGNDLVLDTVGRRISCAGPDGELGVDGDDRSRDDIHEQLPPPAVPATGPSTPTGTDRTPPYVDRVFPRGATSQRTPIVGAAYGDTNSGVDPTMCMLMVDDVDRSADAAFTPSAVQWIAKEELEAGSHRVLLKLQDKAGNVAERSWRFSVNP